MPAYVLQLLFKAKFFYCPYVGVIRLGDAAFAVGDLTMGTVVFLLADDI